MARALDKGKGDSKRDGGRYARDTAPLSSGAYGGSGRSSADLDRAMRNIEGVARDAGPDVGGPGLG